MGNYVKKLQIVSLSRGLLGEDFVQFEVEIGLKRLKEMGVEVCYSENALKGIKYLEEHPEARANDLINAFEDDSVDMIFCAIGGDDTYRLLPYLFENDRLKNSIKKKIFLGFSDTTMNHFMLHKAGLNTFYGQSFIADTCEIGKEMLPYTKQFFEELIKTGNISEIKPAEIWYETRSKFSPDEVGTELVSHKNQGFELLQGPAVFKGKILGGCIDSMYDIFTNYRYEDTKALCEKYELFPKAEAWKDKIILLETSEETPTPEKYKDMLLKLKEAGVFTNVNGVLVGKPQNEIYFDDYKKLLVEVVDNKDLPIVANINIGHGQPRCIIPFGVDATVDVSKQVITFK